MVRRLNANLEVKGYPQELILITHEPKWVHKRKRLSAKLRWVVASYGESGETIIDIIKRLHDREKLNFRQIATMLKVSDSTLLTWRYEYNIRTEPYRRIDSQAEKKPKTAQEHKTKIRFKQLVESYMKENPESEIVLSRLAPVLGVTRERVRQLYKDMEKEGLPVPYRNYGRERQIEKKARLDSIVKQLLNEGLSYREIKIRLGIGKSYFDQSIKRLVNRGEIPSPLAKKKEELEALDRMIIYYANVFYLGRKAIAEKLDISPSRVGHRVNKLIAEGEVKRLRKKRSKGAILLFDSQVKELKEQGFTRRQIARHLNVSDFDVYNAMKRIKKGQANFQLLKIHKFKNTA